MPMTIKTAHDSPEIFERFRALGLFDEAYYTACYRELIAPGMDPFTHFVASGLAGGLKPAANVDLLVYRILHPDAGQANPISHFLDHFPDSAAAPSLQSALKPVEKTPTFLPTKSFDIDLDESNRDNLAHAVRFAEPRHLDFIAAGKTYRLFVPPADALLDRLRQDRPFAFARLSHGDWDDMYVYERYRGRVARALIGRGMREDHIDRLAMRLCDEFYPDEGVFAENFLVELRNDLRSRQPHPDLIMSVAFKGYPTADEELFFRTLTLKPFDRNRLRIFSDYFDNTETLYDSNLFKRWSISGALGKLPEFARERPVVFMGASRLASLGKRWRLPWLLHITMPPTRAFTERYALLDEARAKIAEANEIASRHGTKRPLFLLQGSSFAYWMMKRLFPDHPDIFYLDLGLALHIWFYDREDIPFMPERQLYGRTIVKNCGLEDYYRNLGAMLTPELAEPETGG